MEQSGRNQWQPVGWSGHPLCYGGHRVESWALILQPEEGQRLKRLSKRASAVGDTVLTPRVGAKRKSGQARWPDPASGRGRTRGMSRAATLPLEGEFGHYRAMTSKLYNVDMADRKSVV